VALICTFIVVRGASWTTAGSLDAEAASPVSVGPLGDGAIAGFNDGALVRVGSLGDGVA